MGGWADTGGYKGLGLSPVRGTCLPPLPQVTQGSLQMRNPHPAWPDLLVDGGGRGRLSGGACSQGFSLMARRPRGQALGTRPTCCDGWRPGVRTSGTLVPASLRTLPTSSPMTKSTGPGPTLRTGSPGIPTQPPSSFLRGSRSASQKLLPHG